MIMATLLLDPPYQVQSDKYPQHMEIGLIWKFLKLSLSTLFLKQSDMQMAVNKM